MLALERVGVDRLIGLTKRRIDDHLFLVRMLVERMRQLHQQHLALERLRFIGREHLVEYCERHVMLRSQDLVPVAGGSFNSLHHRLAAIDRGEADRDAREGGTKQRSGIVAPRNIAAVLAARPGRAWAVVPARAAGGSSAIQLAVLGTRSE